MLTVGLGLALAAAVTAAVLAPPSPLAAAPASPSAAAGERRLVLFYTAEVHGAVEPCGCTSDPLGDLSRLAAVIRQARRAGSAVALVDAGGLGYPEGVVSAKERPAADLRAAFLGAEYERLDLLGAGLAEGDLTGGAENVRPKRLAANLIVQGKSAQAQLLRAARVERVGQIAVAVTGVVDPAVAAAIGGGITFKAEDMHAAARRDVERLRKEGAELVVLLAPVDKAAARRLARESGADVVVLGKRVGAGMTRPESIGRAGGSAFLVAPQDEMQRVGRLEIVLRGPPAPGRPPVLVDAGGPEASRLRREEIDRALERLQVALAQWTGRDGALREGADPVFVAARKQEQADLVAERARLDVPWQPPASGSYLAGALVPLRRSLPRDPAVVTAMKRLDRSIAAQNLKRATPPPPREEGRAFFAGTDKCTSCHKGATKFWKQTVHAHAWKTLVDGGKHADYKCVSCHVTGYGQVGGSSLGFTRKLESVQCETCHGPGSTHVAGEGNEEPLAIRRDTPETVCLGCHNEQHSDTFKFEPYMRDIVGPGHGPGRRQQLGDGPTGHELRSAALAKAKRAGSDQLKKM